MKGKSLSILGAASALLILIALGFALSGDRAGDAEALLVERRSVALLAAGPLAIDDPDSRTKLFDLYGGALPVNASVPLIAPKEPPTRSQSSAADNWESLKEAADQGDKRASCKLATRLEGCREYRSLKSRLDDEIRQLSASTASTPNQLIDRIADNQNELDGYLARCGGAPETLASEEWRYLLAAAQSGHEPSMYQFVMSPPIDSTRPLEYLDALNAYRQFAPSLVEELLRRGSGEGLVAAYFLSSGFPIVGQSPLTQADPARALELASALSLVRGRQYILEAALSNHGSHLDAAEQQRAIAAGQHRAAQYSFRFSNAEHGIRVNRDLDSCGGHWE